MTLSEESCDGFHVTPSPHRQTEEKGEPRVTQDCLAVGGRETQVLVAMVIWGLLLTAAHLSNPEHAGNRLKTHKMGKAKTHADQSASLKAGPPRALVFYFKVGKGTS